MAKPVKVVRSSETKKATTAKNKAVRAARLARQLAKSALTFKQRGRYARRHLNASQSV